MSIEVVILRGSRHVVGECRSCGVIATCPETVWEEQQKEGGFHHCPNGHQWGWTKEHSEREKLRRERDRLLQENARLEEERGQAHRAAERAKKETARLKKRAAGGVCPCCNRHFTALERHMKTQPPNGVSLEAKAKA